MFRALCNSAMYYAHRSLLFYLVSTSVELVLKYIHVWYVYYANDDHIFFPQLRETYEDVLICLMHCLFSI